MKPISSSGIVICLVSAFVVALALTLFQRAADAPKLPVHARHFVNGSLWAARSNALVRINWEIVHASNDAEIATLRMMEYGLTNGPVTDRTP